MNVLLGLSIHVNNSQQSCVLLSLAVQLTTVSLDCVVASIHLMLPQLTFLVLQAMFV